MKKLFLLVFGICELSFAARATTYVVQVADFQFSPSTVNAVVGDVVRFQWSSGFHTTTSVTVPDGVSAWNSPMNATYASFDVTLSVEGSYSYLCEFHPSMTGVINVSGTLPVRFGELLTSEDASGSVMLRWQSYTETNIARYKIMRSTDGNSFETIGTLVPKGNSSSAANYQYTDKKVQAAKRFYYYYVQAEDKDGSLILSSIVMHRISKASQTIGASISPNPLTTAGHAMVRFYAEEQGVLQLTLYDQNGKLLQQTQMMAARGSNSGHWHLANLLPGRYLLKCRMGQLSETVNVLVLQ
ncbi:MAG TPA: T9SS type A sorting domain-containing protein [Phnomibacter sp.]|nr:T9SS type A sorting domain-containing protein [Phnomibacter sp.]